MSNNINYEAVFPPAIYSLRMAHLSPNRNSSKGSYELYDSKQRAVDSLKESTAAAGGVAPGSPESVQDFKQIAIMLQKELEDSKRKEVELQQMLASLKNSQSHTDFLDKQILEASPSNDSVGENVKDAHIKHLQRQVTVLQATLYKSEGWSNRVADAVRERDKALNDVARLTNDIKDMQEDNHQLLRKIEALSSALQEAQRSLRQVTEELNNQDYKTQVVSQLRDEIQRQKSEIKTLKDSVTRLDLENRSLKDPSLEGSCQSLGTVACSQELEHLHKVVDTLKTTVLEQRSYLLNLRQPNNTNSAKSLSSSSAFMLNGSLISQDSTGLRTSPTSHLRGADNCSTESEIAAEAMPQQLMFVHPNQATVIKSRIPIDNLLEMQQVIHSSVGGEYIQSGGRRKLNSSDVVEDSFDLNIPNSSSPLSTPAVFAGVDSRPAPQLVTSRSGYSYSTASQSSQGHLGQQMNVNMPLQNLGNVGQAASNMYSPVSSSQHKHFQHNLSQPEVLSHRNRLEQVSQDQAGSKLDTLTWQMRQWNFASANNSAALAGKTVGDYRDKFDQAESRMPHNQIHAYQVSRPALQVQQETPGQFELNGASAQPVVNENKAAEFENLNLNSTSRAHHIYFPPSNSREGSPQVTSRDRDVMDGSGKVTVPTPHCTVSQSVRAGQEVVYVNTSSEHRVGTVSSSVDPDLSRSKLNSDRLCLVCSKDYSHLSMEDFQTHVFECFDDDAAPETMKPQTLPDRLCPMCNAKFGPAASQSDYEKHVHAHFGEEGPGDNFEIVQP